MGTLVGVLVVAIVGILVGRSVGTSVGASVGDDVGVLVGAPVGVRVGALVGVDVAAIVGDAGDTCAEGATVLAVAPDSTIRRIACRPLPRHSYCGGVSVNRSITMRSLSA